VVILSASYIDLHQSLVPLVVQFVVIVHVVIIVSVMQQCRQRTSALLVCRLVEVFDPSASVASSTLNAHGLTTLVLQCCVLLRRRQGGYTG
jgi:hypothetical protein